MVREGIDRVRLQPPPPLVFGAVVAALTLLIVGLVSQRTYVPMYISDKVTVQLPHAQKLYPLTFTMTQRPEDFKYRCVPPQPTANCKWYMYLSDQPVEDRIRLLLHEGAGATNHPYFLRFGSQGKFRQYPDQKTAPAPSTQGFWQNSRMPLLALYAAVFALFGMLVLWRGRDAAVWLGLFCLCLAPFFMNSYAALTPNAMVTAWTVGVVLRCLAEFALFAMALSLVIPYLQPRTVRLVAAAGFALTLGAALFALLPKYLAIYQGYVDARLDWAKTPSQGAIEILLLGVLPLALLWFGWSKAHEPERSRLAVVATVVLIGVAGPIIDGGINGADHFGELTLLALAIPIGFTYAIPRYHVVDVSFVINRIVIYALLIGVVSALVALAEVLITQFADSPAAFFREFQTSLVRQVPVVFVIVLSLRWVHTKLEEFVNQVLFRKRHKALNELKAFIKRTDFAQTREGLLRGAAAEIAKALGTRGVAIYEISAQGYRRIEHIGAFPQHVGEDDPGIWYMRAERAHARLAGMGSALGERGIAFPMCLRGSLYGTVVCGPRINEQYEGDYAPDEVDVMDELALRLAEQLFALAADDRLEFVNEIVSGKVAGAALVERASELQSANAAGIQTFAPRR